MIVPQPSRARRPRFALFTFAIALLFGLGAALLYSVMITEAERAAAAPASALAEHMAGATTAYLDHAARMLAESARPRAGEPSIPNCNGWMSALATPPPGIRSIQLRSTEGAVLCSARPWFDAQFMPAQLPHAETGTSPVAWSAPLAGAGGSPVALLVARVPVEGSRFVLALTVDLLEFWPLIDAQALTADALVGIVNDDGRIVAHSVARERWIGAALRGSHAMPPAVARFDSDRWLLGYAPIGGTRWSAYAGVPAPAGLQDARFGWTLVLTVIVALTAIATLLALWHERDGPPSEERTSG